MQQPSTRPWLIAHRGARDQAPENTRSAFERALNYPIDGIELDVRLSADNIPFIFHDTHLGRVTGRRTRVEELNRQQLALLDWGAWYHADFTGEPLLTLEETLVLFGPRTRLLIEIKSPQRSKQSATLTRRVVELLSHMPAQVRSDHIFVLSFDPRVLQLVHALAPLWRCVLNAPELNPLQVMALPEEERTHLWAIDVRIGRLAPALVAWAHERGQRIFTYTCNGPRQVQKALRLGVDAILTDRPGWLTQYLGGMKTE